MKKRTISLLTVIMMLLSLTTSSLAVDSRAMADARSSAVLDGYSVGIEARGKGVSA